MPAQASGIDLKNDWNVLVKEATKHNAMNEEKKEEKLIEVVVEWKESC